MAGGDRSQSLRGASMILSLLNSHLVVSRQSNSKSTLRQTKLWEQKEMDPLDFELVDEGKDKVIVKSLGIREPEKDKKTLVKEAILVALSEEALTRAQLIEKLKDITSASVVAQLVSEMKKSTEILVVAKIGKNNTLEQYGLWDSEASDNKEDTETEEETEDEDDTL